MENIIVAILAILFGKGVVAAPAGSTLLPNIATATTSVATQTEPVHSTLGTPPVVAESSLATPTLPVAGIVSASLETPAPSSAAVANTAGPIASLSATTASANSASFLDLLSITLATSANASLITPSPATVTVTKYFVPAPHSMRHNPHPPWATNGIRPGFVPAEPESEDNSPQEGCRDMWIQDDSERWVSRLACPENPGASGTVTGLVSEENMHIQTAPPVPMSTEGIMSSETAPAVPTVTGLPLESTISTQKAPFLPTASLAPSAAADATTITMRERPAAITGTLTLTSATASATQTEVDELVEDGELSE